MKKLILFLLATMLSLTACTNFDAESMASELTDIANDMTNAILGSSSEESEQANSSALIVEGDSESVEATAEESSESSEVESSQDEEIFKEYINKPLIDLMEKVGETGYTATYYADGVDFTDFIDSLKEDYLVGSVEEDPDAKTVKVDLLLKSNAEYDEIKAALEEKLELNSSWLAVQEYGEATYGEGFEVHYLVGKIEEYAEDENTWFLKAECTLSDSDMICEARVTGTTDSPEVIFFDIY